MDLDGLVYQDDLFDFAKRKLTDPWWAKEFVDDAG